MENDSRGICMKAALCVWCGWSVRSFRMRSVRVRSVRVRSFRMRSFRMRSVRLGDAGPYSSVG